MAKKSNISMKVETDFLNAVSYQYKSIRNFLGAEYSVFEELWKVAPAELRKELRNKHPLVIGFINQKELK